MALEPDNFQAVSTTATPTQAIGSTPEPGADVIIDMENPPRAAGGSEKKSALEAVESLPTEDGEYLSDSETIPDPPCTTTVLQQFSVVDQRNRLRRHTKYRDPWIEQDEEHIKVLNRLRRWKLAQDGGVWGKAKARFSRNPTQARRPSDDQLEKLVLHYFPTPGEFTVRIVDFYANCSKKYEVSLVTCLENCRFIIGIIPIPKMC